MQFYPADYRNNANLRRCSWEAKGAWVEIMGLMHDSEEYGILRWRLKEIAKAIGAPMRLLKELADKGVLKGSEKDGEKVSFSTTFTQKNTENLTVFLLKNEEIPLYFSSRMIRDEYVRNKRAASGHKSLENMNVPRKKEQDKVSISPSNSVSDKDTSSPSPSSSTSSTTSSDPNNYSEELYKNDPLSLLSRGRELNQKFSLGTILHFEKFKAAYPKPGNWLAAELAWREKNCDAIAEAIFDDIAKRTAEHANWQEKKFILNPENYLKREEWKNAIIPKPTETGDDRFVQATPGCLPKLREERRRREELARAQAAASAQRRMD